MSDFNRGEVITIEAELQEYTPFDSHALADADSLPTITVKDESNTEKVTAQSMTKSATGKYYYVVTTLTTWVVGNYQTTIVSIYNSITNTYVKNNAFKLLQG